MKREPEPKEKGGRTRVAEREFNIVVVGYGMGRYHCGIIRQVEGLRLKGVCDLDPEKRARAEREQEVRTYASLDEVLSDPEVHVVTLATPHDTHRPLAVRAMEAGKNVVVEKVMCLMVEEADDMIAARDRNRVLLTCFHNRRWDPDYLTVRKAIDSGLLGEVFHVESSIDGYGPPHGWRRERAHGGGQLTDWGAHLVDQALRMIPSPPTEVWCRFQHRVWETDVENMAQVIISFANRAVFNIFLSQLSRLHKPRWYVLGEKGALIKETLGSEEKVRVKTEVAGLTAEMTIPSTGGDWRDFYRNLVAALRGEAPLAVLPEEVRENVRVMEAAFRSAETEQVVRL
jgi:scyllo-inositol 2-dehydrogenase (NADP+)